jgi:hypothetical protein
MRRLSNNRGEKGASSEELVWPPVEDDFEVIELERRGADAGLDNPSVADENRSVQDDEGWPPRAAFYDDRRDRTDDAPTETAYPSTDDPAHDPAPYDPNAATYDPDPIPYDPAADTLFRHHPHRWRRWLKPERIVLWLLVLLALGETAFIVWQWQQAGAEPAIPGERRVPIAAGPSIAPPPQQERQQIIGTGGGEDMTKGELIIRTQPPGGLVIVDGQPRGPAPVSLSALEAGGHDVTVQSRGGSVRHRVNVAGGEITSLVIPLPAAGAAPPSGYLVVRAPVELHIFDGEELVGTSAMDRLRLSTGTHELELRNDALGYRRTDIVKIAASKVTTLRPSIPNGTLAVNATPWAEVWIDGERAGETPLGNLALPAGSHQVRLRHPELGERTVTTVIKVGQPARVSVDMRR